MAHLADADVAQRAQREAVARRRRALRAKGTDQARQCERLLYTSQGGERRRQDVRGKKEWEHTERIGKILTRLPSPHVSQTALLP